MRRRQFRRTLFRLCVPIFIILILLGIAPGPWSGPPAAAQSAAGFRDWVAAFKTLARSEGISRELLERAFADVEYNQEVIRLDQYQPEFVRPIWEYIEARTDRQTIALGRRALNQHRTILNRVARRYGVQPEYIVAIWRLETYYGRNLGDFDTVEALATLAYAGRRRSFWRGELMNALRIVERGYAPLSRLRGSWAGAMGHTQFIPSSYLRRAVDFDGDGRRDLWHSLPDVFASTANYLNEAGWQRGEPFGFEVRLPGGFDYGIANPGTRKSAAEWRAMGVRLANGEPIPDFTGQGAVLLPAGHRGPAFLVLNNYRAILRYNNATAYALTVGLLAERLAGGPGVRADWPLDARPLSRDEKTELQRLLARLGFDPGPIDGMVGPSTRAAIRRYQRHVGDPADGFASQALLAELRRRSRGN